MKKTLSSLSLIVLSVFLFSQSAFVAEASPLVPCGSNGGVECTVCDLQILALRVLDFLVMATALVATLLFINAGVLYVMSSANPANIAKAHKIFTSALVGFLIVLAAWLIINVIMFTLYTDSDMAGLMSDWRETLCLTLYVP